MLAQVVDVPLAAIRRWLRRGYLQPVTQGEDESHGPDYLDFTQFGVAKLLASLLSSGASLHRIDQLVSELTEAFPDLDQPLIELPLVVDGGKLLLHHEDAFAEPHGQRLMGFDKPTAEESQNTEVAVVAYPVEPPPAYEPDGIDDLRLHIYDHLGDADLTASIDAARRVLVHPDATAEDQFVLGELLYRTGDLSAARERYYVALEIDELYVEARVSLGCVLADLDEIDLAIAAFEGVLSLHEPYADAHYHLARLLDRQGQEELAREHWQRLIEVSPGGENSSGMTTDGPWLIEAKNRLLAVEEPVATSFGPAQSSLDSNGSSGVQRL